MKNGKPIINCRVRFKFECPKDWDELAPTKDENIRYCNACGKNVFFCASDEEMTAHARRGNCVAGEILADKDGFEATMYVVGMPEFYYNTDTNPHKRRLKELKKNRANEP